jgi:putative membrane protein
MQTQYEPLAFGHTILERGTMETDAAVIIATSIAFGICVVLACIAAPAAALPRLDPATFARTASAGNAFEIQSSRLALQRSGNPRVRAFAQHVIDDHSVTTTVPSAGAPTLAIFAGPGTALDERHAAMLSQLAIQNGPAFDRLYEHMQLTAHREAIALYSSYAAAGEDPALVGLARNTLPVLRRRMAMACRL